MELPLLFKKTNTGAIQMWGIEVNGATILTAHGQVDGAIQHGTDTIKEGKNLGRANATTPEQQAEAEARARWTKQKKKGYVESIEAAQAGEVDALVEGGILPMLAPSKIYPHFAKKLSFPVFVQPKFDGTRLIAMLADGVCTLWSRTRKQVHSLPHIVDALEKAFPEGSYIFDGEAYLHSMNDDFEGLISLIRGAEPAEGHEVIEYHIYDLPSHTGTFAKRNLELIDLAGKWSNWGSEYETGPLRLVPTFVAQNHDEIMDLHAKNLENGYEGSMIRNDGPYEQGRRSNHLQKLKDFKEEEYSVTDAEEGRGKDAGTVGAFVCVTPEGNTFRARLKATYARRSELFSNPEMWRGKRLTVRFQNLTADGIPRFPVGKGLRDYE